MEHFFFFFFFKPEGEENLSRSFLKYTFLSSPGQDYILWPCLVARKAGEKAYGISVARERTIEEGWENDRRLYRQSCAHMSSASPEEDHLYLGRCSVC